MYYMYTYALYIKKRKTFLFVCLSPTGPDFAPLAALSLMLRMHAVSVLDSTCSSALNTGPITDDHCIILRRLNACMLTKQTLNIEAGYRICVNFPLPFLPFLLTKLELFHFWLIPILTNGQNQELNFRIVDVFKC